MRRTLTGLVTGGLLLVLFVPAAALAQDSWDGPVPVRVRYFEGSVSVQRVQAGDTEEALVNLPLDAGDRIWTGSDGRVELIFDDGTLVWLDSESTVDVVSLSDGAATDTTLLRLWNGRLIAARRDGYGGLRIDAPQASVELLSNVLARIDSEDGRSGATSSV